MSKTTLQNALPAFLVCLSLFFSTNVQNFGYSYIYFIASFSILVCLTLYKLFSSYNKPLALPANPHLYLFLIFIFWAAASIFWSPVSGDSISAVWVLSIFPLGVITAFWSNQQQQKYFQFFLIILLLLIAWKAGMQSFLLKPSLPAPGFFANKNTNAIFVCMILLPICAKFLSKDINKENQFIYGAILFIASLIISLTISRGAMLGLVIGLLFLFIHTLLFKLPLSQFIKLISYLSAGYLTAELINSGSNWQRLNQNTLSGSVNAVTSGRTYLWQSGWEMYQDQPLLGWGLNMYHWLFPQYRHINSPNLGQYAHNDYFQFLIELGPIGCLLFIAFVLTFLLSTKKLYVLSIDKEDKLHSLGLITACIAIFTHSLFTFNLYQPAPLLLLGLYIGVLAQRLNQVTTKNSTLFLPSKFTTPGSYFSLLTIFSLVLVYFTSVNAISINKTYGYYKNNLIALEEVETAHQLTRYKESVLATQLNLYVDLLDNKKNNINNDGRLFLIKRGIKVSEQAIKANPYNRFTYINRAKLYALAPEKDYPERINEITSALSQAVKISPYSMLARYEYVKVLMQLNKKQQAKKVFKEGLGRRYYGNYKDPERYLLLLLALMHDSGDEKAIESLKRQIDFLRAQTKKAGYYTLKAI